MFKKVIGSLAGIGLGIALAVGIVAGSGDAVIPEADAWGIWLPPGQAEACETCFGTYICTVAYGTGGVCSVTLGTCRTVGSCTPGGGGVWGP